DFEIDAMDDLLRVIGFAHAAQTDGGQALSWKMASMRVSRSLSEYQTAAYDAPSDRRNDGMAAVTLKGVSKMFGTNAVVQDVNLEIPDKEFVVMVGPSGCGKTTTLRMIAGLEDVTEGEIYIDRKSTRLNSSHQIISYAVFCLKKN